MAEPVIDVLMTAFNASETIQSAIDSMLAQTFGDFRLVVVDDGSTDETLPLLRAFAARDPRVVPVAKEHSGIVDSLNRGLAHCTADFLARFDADDIAYPHRLATQLAHLRTHPECIAVACAAIHIDRFGAAVGTRTRFPPTDQADARWIPSREPYMLQPFLMVRRSHFDAVGGYRLCEVAEDSDLYWRLRDRGILTNTDDVLGAYRLNPNSISSKSIVHGRRIALCSQLVGISALRREDGVVDLAFDQRRIAAYAPAVTLEDHCRLGGDDLTAGEAIRLRIAASVKLLELVWVRPFELDLDDCLFIRRSIAAGEHLAGPANRAEIHKALTGGGMRQVWKGRLRHALALVGPRRFPYVVLRAAVSAAIPDAARAALKRRLARGASDSATTPDDPSQ